MVVRTTEYSLYSYGSCARKIFQFVIANHPFIFLLTEKSTATKNVLLIFKNLKGKEYWILSSFIKIYLRHENRNLKLMNSFSTGDVRVACCARIDFNPNFFIADHPFIFLLVTKSPGTRNFLFVGKINKPSSHWVKLVYTFSNTHRLNWLKWFLDYASL
jgi:serine protease inhibitor